MARGEKSKERVPNTQTLVLSGKGRYFHGILLILT